MNVKTMLHAMSALDPQPESKPVYGLDDVENEFTFPAEQFGLTFRAYFNLEPGVEVDRIALERRGQSVDLPLCMFDGNHLDDIADEISAALRERGEQRRDDRGEYELARSRDRRGE